MKLRLTDHAQARLVERGIDLVLVKKVITVPDSQKTQESGNILATKALEDGRTLAVVYRNKPTEKLIITFYFL